MSTIDLELQQQAICRQQWEITKGHLRATLTLSGSGQTPIGEITNYEKVEELVNDLIEKMEDDELFYF